MTAQFKVGPVYFDADRDLVRLVKIDASGRASAEIYDDRRDEWKPYPAGFDLATGFWRLGHESQHMNLIPGELTLKDGQWVPVTEEAPKTEEALLAEIAPNDSSMDVMRPALTWATPKPFDAFKGFFKGASFNRSNVAGLDEPHPPQHPLQRMTDPSDPLHGSAALLQAD